MTSRIGTWSARLAAALLATMLVVSASLIGSQVASAETSSSKLMLLVDSSGSMKERIDGKTTKIDAAKSALNKVVDTLSPDAQVGMRMYGAKVFKRSDKGACEDTQMVVPIGTGNRDQLKSEIQKYRPYGETPISYSLEQAAKDLGDTGQRTILLVSDGEETCVPDPCPVAEKIAAQGIDLKIDVVGFKVSGKAQDQLRCVAKKGKGSYYDANSTKELEDNLGALSSRAFELTGTPVTGSADPDTAPEIRTGDWIDKLPAGGGVKYYRVKRTQAASTFWAGVSMQSPVNEVGVDVAWALPPSPNNEQVECGGWSDRMWSIGGKLDRQYISAQVMSYDSSEEACNTGTDLLLAVTVDEEDDVEGAPFQMKIYEEPAIENLDQLPGPADDPVWQEMQAGQLQPVVAGSSLGNAPLVQPGSYQTQLVPGEMVFLKVNADWGQRIQVSNRARTDELDSDLIGVRNWGVSVLSPLGGQANSTSADTPERDSKILSDDDNLAMAATRSIRADNRTDSYSGTSLAGEFYVLLYMEKYTTDEKPFTLPMELTIDVLDEPTGAPQYAGEGMPPINDDAPTAAAPPPAAGQPDPVTAESTDANPDQRRAPVGLVIGFSVGVVVLAGAGIGGLWWLLRR